MRMRLVLALLSLRASAFLQPSITTTQRNSKCGISWSARESYRQPQDEEDEEYFDTSQFRRPETRRAETVTRKNVYRADDDPKEYMDRQPRSSERPKTDREGFYDAYIERKDDRSDEYRQTPNGHRNGRSPNPTERDYGDRTGSRDEPARMREKVFEKDWDPAYYYGPTDNLNYEDESYDRQLTQRQRRNMPMDNLDRTDYPEQYIDDEDGYSLDREDDVAESVSGNYWTNPQGQVDGRRPQPRTPPQDRLTPRQRRRRSTFRSGTPPPPPFMKDFYDRMFWYGVDSDEMDSPADKTMFGGTKGKFNGLAYLGKDDRPPPRRQYYVEEEKDDSFNAEDYYESFKRQTPVTPPYDPPRPIQGDYERRYRRRRSNEYENPVSDQISSWFTDEEENTGDSRSARRQKRQDESSSSWSPVDALDAFFGVNRNRRRAQAEEYDQQMGLGQQPRRRSTRDEGRRRPRSEQRPGYTYVYDSDQDDSQPVADFDVEYDTIDDIPSQRNSDSREALSNDDEEEPIEEPKEEEDSSQRRKRSWEERARAVERVPPQNVPAWGPSGETGTDARSQATIDALEDLQEARQKLAQREKRTLQAMDDIKVLKVDAGLQKKRLLQSQRDLRTQQGKMRQIELDLEDASRALRLAKAQERLAREELAELEDRHWAILSFYDADQAEEAVAEALSELDQTYRAARSQNSESTEETLKPPEENKGTRNGEKSTD